MDGIYPRYSSDNTITGNMVSHNRCGIYLDSSGSSTLSDNAVSNNNYGMYIRSSDGSIISGNIVSSNDYGVFLISSINNEIFYNNFIDNTEQVIRISSSNTWDNGVGEGNFWSDYEGLDDGSDGHTAGDGIGDTDLPHQSVDDYPLMYPWGLDDVIEDIIEDIEDMNLPTGTENSLVSKLENAIKSIEKENYNAAVNQLNAFINHVKAQRGKKIPEAQADELIAAAQWIIDNI